MSFCKVVAFLVFSIVVFQLVDACVAQESFPVKIHVDAARPQGKLQEIWRFFGADEPNYASMPHGQKLIGQLGELRPKQVYFRAHNLLSTGDGTPALKWGSTNAYLEDDDGRPIQLV